jgi:hypothetical protein
MIHCSAIVTGCGWDEENSSARVQLPTQTTPGSADSSPSGEVSLASPTISGAPQKSVGVGEPFFFVPGAIDPAGRRLQFAIRHRPAWAEFDSATGRLSGTPGHADIGTYEKVQISVSNGLTTAALPEFSLQVADAQPGHATVYWDQPLDNVDGSVLTDLAGFRVYYGRLPDHLANRVVIANPGVTSAVIDNLSPETWYFAVAAYTRGGIEGELSEVLAYSVP